MQQSNQHPFDQYFQEHRAELDIEIPNSEVWQHIESRLDGRTIPLWQRLPLWRAAAIIFMIAIGAAALWQLRPEIEATSTTADLPELTITPEQTWATEEAHYQAQADSLLQIVQQYEMYQFPEAEQYLAKVHAINAKIADAHIGEDEGAFELLRSLHQEKIDLLEKVIAALPHQ